MTTHTSAFSPISPLSRYGTLFQRWAQRLLAVEPRATDDPAAEAAAVRALADTYRESDPSFASDLYAAADRHELAAEAAAARRQG
jgi:hypothetical protein